MNSAVRAIRELSERWTAALASGDMASLEQLMTGDIVVVHGNGRVVAGVRDVSEDLRRGLERARIEQTVSPDETVVMGEWAFERARVHTRVTTGSNAATNESDSQTLSILRKGGEGRWRVARVIGVLEQPPSR